MKRLSSKLAHGISDPYHRHWCPGCNEMHAVAVDQPFRNGNQWTFDGNLEAPTFYPSVNIQKRFGAPNRPAQTCHYFVRGGQIDFCGDSTHALAGQTVALPDLPASVVEEAVR